MPAAAWALGVVFALGLLLLALGLRGRRVSDHPHCRRCRFDLFGRSATATHCPECGADLARRRAVHAGLRRRRPIATTFGVVLLVVSIGFTGLLMWTRAKDYDWNRAKPTWWLLRETADAGPRGLAAYQELSRRITLGDLDTSESAAVSDAVLTERDRGLHPTTQRLRVGMELLVTLRAAGKLDDDRWRRFARQAPAVDFRIRSIVRSGDNIPFLAVGYDQTGIIRRESLTSVTPFTIADEMIDRGARIADIRLEPLNLLTRRNSPQLPMVGTLRPLRTLTPGGHELTVRIRRTVNYIGAEVLAWEETHTRPLAVVERGEVPMRPYAPAAGVAMFQAFETQAWWNPFTGRIDGVVRVTDRDMPLSVTIFCEVNGKLLPYGHLRNDPALDYVRALRPVTGHDSVNNGQARFSIDLAPPPATVELILRPNIELAEETVGITDMWMEDIRLTVPVRGGGGAPTPADAAGAAQG